MENSEKPGPLDGVRVLDLGHYIAIPILTRMMADLGAEIIKIEAAPHGDLTRFTPIIKNGYSGSFIQHNRGKQSVCVDLKTPEGADIVRDLARSVDVITENYSPGVLPRYGLGYEDFRKVNQRVIMLSISGFGQDGPLKHRVGNDTVALAMSGLMHLTGDPDGPPVYVGLFIADENAGVHGLAAVCAALYYREKTGIGQYIDLSLLECMFHLHDTAIQFYVMSEGKLNPNRFGSHHYLLAPCGIFKASDGYVVITVLDHQWETSGTMAAIVCHARRTTRDTGEGTHSKRAGAGHRADYQSPGDPGARRDAIDSASGTRSGRDSEVSVSHVGNAGNDPQSSTSARRA
jgi:crotonobetainyl-CoA:carnitine CoA-transferase CaiB-like acyl-CoA transferase